MINAFHLDLVLSDISASMSQHSGDSISNELLTHYLTNDILITETTYQLQAMLTELNKINYIKM